MSGDRKTLLVLFLIILCSYYSPPPPPNYHTLILGQACLLLGLALAVAAMNLRMNDSRPVL